MAESAVKKQQEPSRHVNWAELKPKIVDAENAMSYEDTRVVWNKMYKLAGLNSPNEAMQMSFRLAVYTYACINGTSRVGNYNGNIVMSDGFKFPASVIPQATGKMAIRKFFRGNMEESYNAMKESRVMEDYPKFLAKVATFGISAECAFSTADWLTDCPLMTPSEHSAHQVSFVRGTERARRIRNGENLEAVESAGIDAMMATQGRLDAVSESHGRVQF